MNVKGTSWISMIDYLKENYSAEEMARLKGALNPEDRQAFDRTILPVAWLDYGIYMRVLMTADRVLGCNDHEVCNRVNIYQARQDINGIYKMLISILSPQAVLKTLFKIQRQYYDKGKVEIVEIDQHHAVIKYTEVPDVPMYHELDNGTYVSEVLRMAGAKNVEFKHTQCMARGDDHCRHEIVWQ